MTSKQRTWPQHVATVLINELKPRLAKAGRGLWSFDSDAFSLLCLLEFRGLIDRRGLRQVLDGLI